MLKICIRQREAIKVLLLTEKVKVLDLIKKERKTLYGAVAKVCGKNESSNHEIVRKKR